MIALLLLLTGCGTAPPEATAEAPEPTVAAACTLGTGFSTLSLDVDGTTREALVRRGSKASERAPVVFVWHGFGSSAENMVGAVRPESHFDDALVVVPTGLGRTFEKFGPTPRPGWQKEKGELGDRDLALFDALMAELEPCIDPKRVYSTGFSNGGFFSNLLGCERADQITAIAPVGGGLPGRTQCPSPVPTLIVHGRQDPVVPYQLALDAGQTWATTNGCPEATLPTTAQCADATCDSAALRMCPFDGEHTWPRWATAEIRSFFDQAG